MNSRLNKLLIRAGVLTLLLLIAIMGKDFAAAQPASPSLGLLAYVTNDSDDTVSVIDGVGAWTVLWLTLGFGGGFGTCRPSAR